MREVPCDIGEPQILFDDAVCRMFEDPDGEYEVLDRNMNNDPFEPDMVIMDSDEWVFTVLCYYIEDYPSDGFVEIYPKTFGMRKWVQDDSERPAFLALGVGGTPENPEELYFARFYNFGDSLVDLNDLKRFRINWMRPAFFDKVVREDFERIFSPR